MSDAAPATLPYEQWCNVKSVSDIKAWLNDHIGPELNMCIMAQLDAIYSDLVKKGLTEVTTEVGIRPLVTRMGTINKYVIAVNYFVDGAPQRYAVHMRPDDITGRPISLETRFGEDA